MVILISGGCKNGKTSVAEKIINNISGGKNMYYVATMIPYDNEDKIRIAKHIEERSKYNFKTIEIEDSVNPIFDELSKYSNIDFKIKSSDNSKLIEDTSLQEKETLFHPAFLFDSITAYLLNHIIDRKGEFDDNNLKDNKKTDIDFNDEKVAEKIITDFQKLINMSRASNIDIIFVSDYIYGDVDLYDDFVKYYARSLGSVDSFVAKSADAVIEVSAGNIIYHKGKENVEKYL